MNTKVEEGNSGNESQFELKYCERCGGLWLRPTGGGQVYCTACHRGMEEMPPASHERRGARIPQGPKWGGDASPGDGYEEDEELEVDPWGGVA